MGLSQSALNRLRLVSQKNKQKELYDVASLRKLTTDWVAFESLMSFLVEALN